MNTHRENDETAKAREAHGAPPGVKPTEAEEEAAQNEAADSREMAEGGYGWGV
jgi:hypothetical protein